MESQYEALDLSVGVKRNSDDCLATEKEEPEVVKNSDPKESIESEPPKKRQKLSPTGPHKAVLQWLADNSFEQCPPSMSAADKVISVNENPPQHPMQALRLSDRLSPFESQRISPINCPLPEMARTIHNITVTLQDEHLWNAFNHTGTEMIINKSGRRMFPYVTISAQGLDPDTLYSFYLEVVQVDEHCYKYVNKQWVPVGMGEKVFSNPPVSHSDSPKPGSFWMKNNINFASVKITNTASKETRPNQILLRSMHKYMTRIHIVKETMKDSTMSQPPIPLVFHMPETSFIAVTAYKNKAVTYMKIMNNPFAKPFRESSSEAPPRARCLRKLFNGLNSDDKKEQPETISPMQTVASKPSLCPPSVWYPMPPYSMAPQLPMAARAPFLFAPPPFISPFSPFLRPFGHMPLPTQPMQ